VDSDVQCWQPGKSTLQRISRMCPQLRTLRVLLDDLNFRELECLGMVEEVEAHITWSGLTAGFDIFVGKVGQNLTSLEMTLLDNYSWTTVVTVGLCCPLLNKLHLTLWREDLIDTEALDLRPSQVPDSQASWGNLQDLKVKCEVYVEFLPEQVFEFFFQQCQRLKIVQFIGPIDWIVHEDILDVFHNNSLADLEMLVLANTSSEQMNLGMPTVLLFLEKCKHLIGLGDLKTWKKIDFYDPESEHFFKTESAFTKLQKDAVKKNWEIVFDLENLDFLY